MLGQSFHCYHHRKTQVDVGRQLHQRHLSFHQNHTLLLYFQGLHLQVAFYLEIFHPKYPPLLALINLLNHLLAQALEDH